MSTFWKILSIKHQILQKRNLKLALRVLRIFFEEAHADGAPNPFLEVPISLNDKSGDGDMSVSILNTMYTKPSDTEKVDDSKQMLRAEIGESSPDVLWFSTALDSSDSSRESKTVTQSKQLQETPITQPSLFLIVTEEEGVGIKKFTLSNTSSFLEQTGENSTTTATYTGADTEKIKEGRKIVISEDPSKEDSSAPENVPSSVQ